MNICTEPEKVIDLKQLVYYVLKRWKRIFIFLLVGILLGTGLGLLKGEPSLEDIDTTDLNMEKILQYHHAQVLYKQQLENEQNSILLQMDPNQVYQAQLSYYLTVPLEQSSILPELISGLLADGKVLDELIAAGGFECDHHGIQELVSISYTSVSEPTVWTKYGLTPKHAKLFLNVLAPDEATGLKLLNLLNKHVTELQDTLVSQYRGFSYQKMDEYHAYGYNEHVYVIQKEFVGSLKNYSDDVINLKTTLADDELLYYSKAYNVKETEFSVLKQTIKYAILLGALLCMIGCAYYVVMFLMDNRLKAAYEIKDYGLYTIACLHGDQVKKKDLVDKLFSGSELPANSKEYLLSALRTLDTDQMVLCGNQQDTQIADTMKWLASQMKGLCVADTLSTDESSLKAVKDSTGVILFVRLWETSANDFRRELEILKQMNKTIAGVVIIDG